MPEYRFEEISINSTEKKKPVEADKDTYLGLEHLDSGSLRVMRWGAEVAPIGDKLVMYKGDVLFGRRRAYQKKVAIAPFDGIFSAHGMVLRPRTEVISERLFPFFIASDYFLDAAIKISVGSLSPTINWRDLKDLKFNIPPLAQQDELAEKMWAFEETKEAYSRLMAATDALVKSQFIEMFGDPVANPMGWKTECLANRCDIITGNTPPRRDSDNYGRFIEWIKSDNLNTSSIYPTTAAEYLSEKGFHICRYVDAGSILMTCIAGSIDCIGNAAITDRRVAFNQQINAVVPHKDNVIYMYWLLQMGKPQMQRLINKALKGILSKGQLSNMRFIFPPLELQNRFAAFVESTDKSKFALQQNIERLEMCRNALMRKTFG